MAESPGGDAVQGVSVTITEAKDDFPDVVERVAARSAGGSGGSGAPTPTRQSHWKLVRDLAGKGSDPQIEDEDERMTHIHEIEEVLGKSESDGPRKSFLWPAPPPEKSRWDRLKDGDDLPVVHPDGMFRIKWDIMQVISLCYVSVIVPMRIGFHWPAVGLLFVCDMAVDLLILP